MSDPEDTEDQMPLCDLCEVYGERLTEVEDRDDSVGYRNTMLLCDNCLEAKRGKR